MSKNILNDINCGCLSCRLKRKRTKYNLSIREWSIKDTQSLGILLIIFLIWISFEQKFLKYFNGLYTEKFSKNYEHSPLSYIILGFLFIYFSVVKFPNLFFRNFFTPYRYLLLPFFMVIIYYYYRIQNYFNVQYNFFGISIIDFIVSSIFFYIIFATFFDSTSNSGSGFKCDKDEFKFYHDKPLNDIEKDELGFDFSADFFYKNIRNTLYNQKESISIGINGAWGEGKSSFMYLLKRKFNKEFTDFIVLEFNPRHAKSKEVIQSEFFQLLFDELKQYDQRFSSSFNNYLKAIKIIDSKSIIDFVKYGFDAVFDKEDEKNKINNAITRINKKVIVFVDDLDRLLDEEIIEVFKLIDGNASFDNMVFITAYDKTYVNKIFEKYNQGGRLFIDKFFTIEKSLPYISKQSYIEYLINQLKLSFKDSLTDLDYNSIRGLAEKNLHNLRDCKRFLNKFVDEYKLKFQGVDFKNFFILTLIEYQWKKYYDAIKLMEIVKVGDNIDKLNTIILKENWKEAMEKNNTKCDEILNKTICIDENFIELLEELFSSDRTSSSITNKNVFDNYFKPYVNEYANPFIIEEMFEKSIQENRFIIDEIINHKQEAYLLEYVTEKKIEFFKDESTFFNYIDILFYVYSKLKNYNVLLSILNIIEIDNLTKLTYIDLSNNLNNYKKLLSIKLFGKYPHYFNEIVYSLLLEFIDDEYAKNNIHTKYIFKFEELLKINKDILNDLIKKEPVLNLSHLELLSQCLVYKDNYSNLIDRLDDESVMLVKDLIIKNPEKFFENFVTLEGISSSNQINSITRKLFWDEIFGDKESFKSFIFNQKFDNFSNINTVRNFWELYENNGFNPIKFYNKGNVQDKIDKGLKVEKEQLDEILKLKSKFDEIYSLIKDSYSELLEKKGYSFLETIDFNILLNEDNFNRQEFLNNLFKLKDLLDDVNKKDYKGDDIYWLDLELIKELKYYEVRTLKLYDVGLLSDVIEFFIDKYKEEIIEKIQMSQKFESLCFNSLQPELNFFNELSMSISKSNISIDLDNNKFYFKSIYVNILGGHDKDKSFNINSKATGEGNFNLNERGVVESIDNLKLDGHLFWG